MERSKAAVRAIFWLAMTFAIVFFVRAESGDRRASMPHAKSAPPIRIVDQNGRPAVNGVPSATSTIVDVMVGGGNGFQFVPDTVNISVGDTVRWTWVASGHSVTSGPPCVADSQYCSPNDMNCSPGTLSNQGTVYTHTFAQPGVYSYHCLAHCRYRYDWRGQCFGWLRAVGMVSRSGLAYGIGQSSWRLFPGGWQLLYSRWPHLGCGRL